jgi:hypothetical protein
MQKMHSPATKSGSHYSKWSMQSSHLINHIEIAHPFPISWLERRPRIEESGSGLNALSADIANRPGALMCEPCKRECLAYVQDFLSMDLITQQWISGSVWRCTVGWGKWLQR